MDSSQQEKLAELRQDLEQLKDMVAALERKIEELSIVPDGREEESAEHIELVHEDFLSDISDVAESVPSEVSEPEAVAVEETVVEPEVTDAAAPESETTAAPEPAETEDDESSLFGGFVREEPAKAAAGKSKTLNEVNAARAKKAISDARPEKPAWYMDMPGPEVRDVRSAISLNDRVMFISTLFREDSMLFQDVVNRINFSTSLDKAVDYLTATFPEWDMYSEPVYRFMMAVRRKIR